jgi:hypothetical protein
MTAGATPATADGADAAEATDEFFGFIAGLYAAAVASPAVAATTDPGALFFVLLGSVVLVTGVVGWLGRRESLAVGLGATRWVWVAVALPLGYLAALFAAGVVRGGTPPGPSEASRSPVRWRDWSPVSA